MVNRLFGILLLVWVVISFIPSVYAQSNTEFEEKEVVIQNEQEGLELRGRYCIPKKQGPWPAVLLVNVQPFSDADQANSGIPMYKDLAHSLASSGFAVLRMHGRCWTNPSLLPAEATLDQLNTDVLTAISWLRKQRGVRNEPVGLINYQDNMLAALDFCANEDVGFIVGLQPISSSALEHICEQTSRVLANTTLPDSTQIKYLDLLYVLLSLSKQGDQGGRLQRQMDDVVENHLPMFAEWEIEHLALARNDRKYLLSYLNSAHMQSFIKQPYQSVLKSCQLPVMIIAGKSPKTVGFPYRWDILQRFCVEKSEAKWKCIFWDDHDHYLRKTTNENILLNDSGKGVSAATILEIVKFAESVKKK
jgi:hypothetical protein